MMVFVLALLILAANATTFNDIQSNSRSSTRTQIAETNAVHVLTDETFGQFISDHERVFVLFNAPARFNCSHSHKLTQEFATAAKALPFLKQISGVDISTALAMIECNDELLQNIQSNYGLRINVYPTMAYFNQGQITDVSSGAYKQHNAHWILKFLKNKEQTSSSDGFSVPSGLASGLSSQSRASRT